jgi:hypothetical protein
VVLPVPSPRTFAVSEVEVASYLNSIRDALLFLLNPPIGQFYQSAAQSVPNAGWTSLTFDLTDRDTYGGHSNVTNNSRYTAIVAGVYELTGGGGFATNATGTRDVAWAKNGVLLSAPGATGTSNAVTGLQSAVDVPTLQIFLNVGDYVELQAFQSSGGNLNTATGQYGCLMGVKFVHA